VFNFSVCSNAFTYFAEINMDDELHIPYISKLIMAMTKATNCSCGSSQYIIAAFKLSQLIMTENLNGIQMSGNTLTNIKVRTC
jgi:hypothetical protein